MIDENRVEKILRDLEYTRIKHKDVFVPTGATSIFAMASECALMIKDLRDALAASERREKAAVADLHGYCKACINIAKTIDFDELAKPICRECNKIIKQNWQWRGERREVKQ